MGSKLWGLLFTGLFWIIVSCCSLKNRRAYCTVQPFSSANCTVLIYSKSAPPKKNFVKSLAFLHQLCYTINQSWNIRFY